MKKIRDSDYYCKIKDILWRKIHIFLVFTIITYRSYNDKMSFCHHKIAVQKIKRDEILMTTDCATFNDMLLKVKSVLHFSLLILQKHLDTRNTLTFKCLFEIIRKLRILDAYLRRFYFESNRIYYIHITKKNIFDHFMHNLLNIATINIF